MPPDGRQPHWRVPSGKSHHLHGKLKLLLIVLTTFQRTAIATGSVTQCIVERIPEDTATITCKFPQNLNRTKKSFCLIQYEGGEKRADVVTACSWEGTKPLCVFEDGFRFYHITITTEFTVELPVQKAIGEFSCDTIPPDLNVHVQKCQPKTTGPVETKDKNADVPAASNDNQQFSNSTGSSASENCGRNNMSIIYGLGASTGVLFLALIVTLMLYVRTLRPKRMCGSTDGSQPGGGVCNGTNCSRSSQDIGLLDNDSSPAEVAVLSD